jgi:hypothetical protein
VPIRSHDDVVEKLDPHDDSGLVEPSRELAILA